MSRKVRTQFLMTLCLATSVATLNTSPTHAGVIEDSTSGSFAGKDGASEDEDWQDGLTQAQIDDVIDATSGGRMSDGGNTIAWQIDFVPVVEQLRADYPNKVAGVRIEADTADSTWVAFKGTAPANAVAAIAAISPDIDIVENVGYSELDLLNYLIDVHYDVMARTDVVATAGSWYDTATGTVESHVEALGALDSLGKAALKADLLDELAAPPSNVTLSLEVVDQLDAGDEANLLGGGRLEHSGQSALQCTSGFNGKIESTPTVRVLITAQHCDPEMTWEIPNGGTEYATTSTGSHNGAFGDVRRLVSAETEIDDFYNNWTETRDVTGVRTAVEGQRLYKFGIAGGRMDDTVYRLNVCQGDACRLVAMSRRYTYPGDSGGPWYWGNDAYGIHKGYMYMFPYYRSTWSQVVNLPSAIGVFVAID